MDLASATLSDEQAEATRVLLHYTLLVDKSKLICGNCGEKVPTQQLIFCTSCAVYWKFSGITYPSTKPLEEQARTLKKVLPSTLTFIGQLTKNGVRKAYLPLSFD